jgi:ribosomal-protein-alanine N-acetyltransferase
MIREASIKDIEKISEIEKEWEDYPLWGVNGFEKEFEKKYSKTFVYEDNGVWGFVNIWDLGEEIEINTIAVDKNKVKRGIGSALLDYIIDYSYKRKAKRILLEVNEENLKAIKLYQKKGFVIYNKRKKYYDLKYDALLMKKELL